MPVRASVQVGTSTFYELFNQENKLNLPLFQRDYSWEEEELEKFWSDIEKTIIKPDTEHFIGQIVLGAFEPAYRSTNPFLRNFYNIIDGQQRITTATIFLCALRDIAVQSRNIEIARSIEKYVIATKESPCYDDHFIVTLGYLDKDFFKEYILFQFSEPKRKTAQEYKKELSAGRIKPSNENLYYAYTFFFEKIFKRILNVTNTEKANILTRLQDGFLRDFFFILIRLPDISEGSQIFETLNAYGERLEAIDLVKNLVFMKRQSQGITPSQLESELIEWNDSVAKLKDVNPSRFLRHYWLSKYNDAEEPVTIENLYGAFCNKAESSAGFAKQLLNDVREYSDIYVVLNEPSAYVAFDHKDETKKKVENSLKGLDAMNASRSFPVLMSTYKNFPKEFPRMCRLMEILVFRYSLICNFDAKRLENTFNEISVAFENADKSNPAGAMNIFESKLTELKKVIPQEEQFKNNFKFKSTWNSKAARYVLSNIEVSEGTGETLLDNSTLTLEHIFPKSPSDECKREVGDDLTNLIARTNSIGNFTLILGRWNQAMSNRPFGFKKNNFYSKSEVKMTKNLSKETGWSSSKIDERNAAFMQKCLKLWDPAVI